MQDIINETKNQKAKRKAEQYKITKADLAYLNTLANQYSQRLTIRSWITDKVMTDLDAQDLIDDLIEGGLLLDKN